MLELLVLHAAERLLQQSEAAAAAAAALGSATLGFGGRYVLDLLLAVLDVAQEWAAIALSLADASSAPSLARSASSACASSAVPPGTRQPVLFTELAGGTYYSRQQALALQQLGFWDSSSSRGQPLVIHPVDPTCSVFNLGSPFELWAELRQAAELLQQQLLSCSWRDIRQDSTLSAVLALGG